MAGGPPPKSPLRVPACPARYHRTISLSGPRAFGRVVMQAISLVPPDRRIVGPVRLPSTPLSGGTMRRSGGDGSRGGSGGGGRSGRGHLGRHVEVVRVHAARVVPGVDHVAGTVLVPLPEVHRHRRAVHGARTSLELRVVDQVAVEPGTLGAVGVVGVQTPF